MKQDAITKNRQLKPIFIIGAPRSGTTFFFNVLSSHPEIACLSGPAPILYNLYRLRNTFKNNKYLFMAFHSAWILADEFFVTHPYLTKEVCNIFNGDLTTSEGNKLWGNTFKRLLDSSYTDVLTEDDATNRDKKRLRGTVDRYARCYPQKNYLLFKSPQCSVKIRYLNEIFPNALYVHLIRDGRAVANSIYNRRKQRNINKWWGVKVNGWEEIEKNNSPLIASALQWKEVVSYIRNNKDVLGDRYLEIKYENLVDDFDKTLNEVCEFIGIDNNIKYAGIPKNMNYKWKKQLDRWQQVDIEESIQDYLLQLGYKEGEY